MKVLKKEMLAFADKVQRGELDLDAYANSMVAGGVVVVYGPHEGKTGYYDDDGDLELGDADFEYYRKKYPWILKTLKIDEFIDEGTSETYKIRPMAIVYLGVPFVEDYVLIPHECLRPGVHIPLDQFKRENPILAEIGGLGGNPNLN